MSMNTAKYGRKTMFSFLSFGLMTYDVLYRTSLLLKQEQLTQLNPELYVILINSKSVDNSPLSCTNLGLHGYAFI